MLAPSTRTDGIPRMIAFGEMARYPLVTMVGESVNSIDAPLWRMIWSIAGLLILVTLAVLLSAWRSISLLTALHRRGEELSLLATTDDLTGLSNRRQFLQTCDEEMARAKRYKEPLAFLELDLDFFKRINDAYGHAAGDEVLKALARVGQSCLRDVDQFGRLGGEEFGILLPNTDVDGALHLAERIVAAVAACEVPSGDLILRFTTSIGVTAMGADDTGFEDIFARADLALYEAKAHGRNCVRSVPAAGDGISDNSTKGEKQ
jgi:diguanylate cyclase (GGDEF)-like protein